MGEEFKLKSLSNMASILNLFSEENFELGVMDISRKLRVGKSTVHRVLASLEAAGLVEKTERQKYVLGFKILELANILLNRLDIKDLVYPHALKLRDLTDETVALHLLSQKQRICLFQVESLKELRSSYKDIGKPLPLHLGSAGKVIMAYLTQADFEAALANVKDFDFEKLKKDLEEIRHSHYGFTLGERTQGIASVSAPIFGANNKIVGAMNISGPSIRFPKTKADQYSKLLLKETEEISRLLALTAGLRS